MLFGVTSQDMMFALSGEEVSASPAQPHRLTRLAGHLLEQQSFFPLLPPPPALAAQVSDFDVRYCCIFVVCESHFYDKN